MDITNLLNLLYIIFTCAVIISYVNYRYIKLQSTIAITTAALLISIMLLLIAYFGNGNFTTTAAHAIAQIDFHALLMNGMLSFLLFAGALNINFADLKKERWEIGLLAFVGTILSTVIIGYATYYVLLLVGVTLPLINCFLFGALISPTDPIAVLAIFKRIGAPRSLAVRLAGESLFNDGVGVVLFVTLYQVAFQDANANLQSITFLFLKEAVGGMVYGFGLGMLGYLLIKPIDHYKQEIFITLAIATGGYTLAQTLDVSGPLAMVVAGLVIGNHGKQFHMSKRTQENLDNFWELIDDALNALLFLLIGLELLTLHLSFQLAFVSFLAILIILTVRIITVGLPLGILSFKRHYDFYDVGIMIWGGLRGGLAIAMALAIPKTALGQHYILAMTYCVVVFSIIVQGLSTKKLVKLAKRKRALKEGA